jgi:hypothetical protein
MLQIDTSGDEVGRSVIIRSKPTKWGKSENLYYLKLVENLGQRKGII